MIHISIHGAPIAWVFTGSPFINTQWWEQYIGENGKQLQQLTSHREHTYKLLSLCSLVLLFELNKWGTHRM